MCQGLKKMMRMMSDDNRVSYEMFSLLCFKRLVCVKVSMRSIDSFSL